MKPKEENNFDFKVNTFTSDAANYPSGNNFAASGSPDFPDNVSDISDLNLQRSQFMIKDKGEPSTFKPKKNLFK